MRIKEIVNYFDKKKFLFVLRLIFLFFVVVLEVNIISIAYSKYESEVNTSAVADIALFLTGAGTYSESISLSGLVPSTKVYSYDLYVSNYKDDDRTNVNMSYTVEFSTTTNLPLMFDIIDKDTGLSVVDNQETVIDDNGVYYEKIGSKKVYSFTYESNQKKYFTLLVTFPIVYSNNSDEYQSLIDLFTITVDAKQVV